MNGQQFDDDSSRNSSEAPKKLLSTGFLVGSILVTFLSGLALVVRSLRNIKLTLYFKLKKDDKAEKKY
jgi:hypothetical protein